MRTTLINTTFWKEETIDELHLDSKLLYLYMLTNPEKGLANIYHYKPKVISAYSGLSPEQVDISLKQLVLLGYVDVFEGFYVLLKGHEMPKKGRFTEKTMDKEKELVPEHVLDHFNLLINQSSSGVAPEHKDNNKDNTNNISITKTSSKDIDFLFSEWHEIVGYEITSNIAANRTAAASMLKRYNTEELERMFKGVSLSQEDQYAPRISNLVQLEKKWDDLKAWGKRKIKTSSVVEIN